MFPVLLAAMMLLTTEACGLSIPDSATTDTSNTTAATQSTTVSADATPTVTPLPSITADSNKLVYEDDFSSVDWLDSTSEDVSYSYQDGKYVVTVTDEDYMLWSYAPLPLQSNFMAQVQANDVTPSKDTKYFIVFRLKESGSGNDIILSKYPMIIIWCANILRMIGLPCNMNSRNISRQMAAPTS